jgi:hypothetical protein
MEGIPPLDDGVVAILTGAGVGLTAVEVELTAASVLDVVPTLSATGDEGGFSTDEAFELEVEAAEIEDCGSGVRTAG